MPSFIHSEKYTGYTNLKLHVS